MPIENPDPITTPPVAEITYDKLWVVTQYSNTLNGDYSTGDIQANISPAVLNEDGTYTLADGQNFQFSDFNIFTISTRRPGIDTAVQGALTTFGITVPDGVTPSLYVMQIYGACLASAAVAQSNGN
jgi:hypothetical protein